VSNPVSECLVPADGFEIKTQIALSGFREVATDCWIGSSVDKSITASPDVW